MQRSGLTNFYTCRPGAPGVPVTCWQQVVLLDDEASLVEEVSAEHYESFGMPESSSV